MVLDEMYPPKVNSPVTYLTAGINADATEIMVIDGSLLPDAPNLATLGFGEDSETILYAQKNGNTLQEIIRGFQGTAKAWNENTPIARLFTAYDIDAIMENIKGLNTTKAEKSDIEALQSFDFDNLIPMPWVTRNTEIIKENNTTTVTEIIVHKDTLIKIADRITVRDGSNVIIETTKFYGDDGETIIKQASIMTTINPDKSITEEVV